MAMYQDSRRGSAETAKVSARALEAFFIAVIMLAVLAGGPSLLANAVQFHGLSVSVLGGIAIFLIYAFRRNFLAGGPGARLYSTRDAAFLAAIAAAIAFVLAPAKWSLGAAVVALEMGLAIELLARFNPALPKMEDR
jgi:hypothetical protein